MGARAAGPALITPRVPVGSAQGVPRPPPRGRRCRVSQAGLPVRSRTSGRGAARRRVQVPGASSRAWAGARRSDERAPRTPPVAPSPQTPHLTPGGSCPARSSGCAPWPRGEPGRALQGRGPGTHPRPARARSLAPPSAGRPGPEAASGNRRGGAAAPHPPRPRAGSPPRPLASPRAPRQGRCRGLGGGRARSERTWLLPPRERPAPEQNRLQNRQRASRPGARAADLGGACRERRPRVKHLRGRPTGSVWTVRSRVVVALLHASDNGSPRVSPANRHGPQKPLSPRK